MIKKCFYECKLLRNIAVHSARCTAIGSTFLYLQTSNFPSLGQNLSADVVVVGAGIAGLSIAYRLSKEGMFARERAELYWAFSEYLQSKHRQSP